MEEYSKYLNKILAKDLKTLIKKYITHVTIRVSGKSKKQLIEDIMKHTELINGKIYLKPISFELPPSLKKEMKPKIEEQEHVKDHIKTIDEEIKLHEIEKHLHETIKKGSKDKKINDIWQKCGLLRLKIAKSRTVINQQYMNSKPNQKIINKNLQEINHLRNEAKQIIYLYDK